VISPSNPDYLRVSAHDNPAGPAPTITNFLGSLPFLVIYIVLLAFNLVLSILTVAIPLFSTISNVYSPSKTGPY